MCLKHVQVENDFTSCSNSNIRNIVILYLHLQVNRPHPNQIPILLNWTEYVTSAVNLVYFFA